MDTQKLEEIQKASQKIWKLADLLPTGTILQVQRKNAIKETAELIRELAASVKDSE